MKECWHEVATKRPSFTELRSKFEVLISEETPYMEFDIDNSKAYYLTPSFKSAVESDDDNNDEDNGDSGLQKTTNAACANEKNDSEIGPRYSFSYRC